MLMSGAKGLFLNKSCVNFESALSIVRMHSVLDSVTYQGILNETLVIVVLVYF